MSKVSPTTQAIIDAMMPKVPVNEKEFRSLVAFVEKGFKTSNAEFRRLTQENADLRARLDALEGKEKQP